MIRTALVAVALLPLPAMGQEVSFPSNATLTSEHAAPVAAYPLAVGPWRDGTVPQEAYEGALTRQTWRIDATGLTTTQVLRPLKEQLRNQGFVQRFECDARACGGFDFRFAISVVLPPAMQVNLGDFRYFAATKADGTAVSALISRTDDAAFVQLTRIGAEGPDLAKATAPSLRSVAATASDEDLATALETRGRYVLEGLTFAIGSAQLDVGEPPVLDALAQYLAQNPHRTVALVGHTDAEGALDGNIALSKRRAGAVLERLVQRYGVARQQLAAEGMGYLAPIASNLSAEGREQNRRVEVIVTSTR